MMKDNSKTIKTSFFSRFILLVSISCYQFEILSLLSLPYIRVLSMVGSVLPAMNKISLDTLLTNAM